jgi:endonuclease III
VGRLVESFLLWESSLSRAQRALEALRTELVDLNELRVCLPSEVVGVIGVRYPLARERAERIRTCLRAVYESTNGVTLAGLSEQAKRQARTTLDAIPGMVPFVSARVVLLELGGHAFPVDARVREYLRSINCESEDDASLSSKLERVFRAGELVPIHHALERHFDKPARGRDRSRARSGSRSK